MDRYRTALNIAIVLLIAAAVDLLPNGGRAANTFAALIYIAFGVAIGYIGLRLYRENRVALHSLGDLHRGLLYGAVVVTVLALMSRARMWETGIGELLWFVLIGGVVWTFLAVYRHWRAY